MKDVINMNWSKKLRIINHWLLLASFFFFCFTCYDLNAEGSDPFSYTNFETTAKMRTETKYFISCIEEVHYSKKNIDEISGEDFMKFHLNQLDSFRMYFKSSEIDDLILRFGKTISYYLKQGNLFPAFEIFKIHHQNRIKRYNWVFSTLKAQNFDFTIEDYYQIDRSESNWFVSELEANQIWHQRLKYEILNEILTLSLNQQKNKASLNNPSNGESTLKAESSDLINAEDANHFDPDEIVITEKFLQDALDKVRKRYQRLLDAYLKFEPDEVQEEFLISLAKWHDPHSHFFSHSQLEEFKINLENSFVGIGARLNMEDGYCTIVSLIAGAPAKKSKELYAGDKILAIAQGRDGEFVNVVEMKLKKIVKLIRGEEGSEVAFIINPNESEDPSARKTVIIKRGEVKLTERLASAKIFNLPVGKKTCPIGVIDLPSFYGSNENDQGGTTKDVKHLIEQLKDMGVEGIILDLRLNGGGLLNEAVDLTGLFIRVGSVVQIKGSDGLVNQLRDENPEITWEGPLAIMVSRNSASGSEILAGALQNHKRALILGDASTHGKGTVQMMLKMSDTLRWLNYLSLKKPQYGGAKITLQKFFLPNGHSTQLKGVESDIVFPSINELLPIGEADLENTLSWEKIPSVNLDTNWGSYGVDKDLIKKLKHSYLMRKQSMPEFAFLEKRISKIKEMKEQELVSLNFNVRKKQRWIDSQYQKSINDTRTTLIKENLPFEKIVLPATLARIDDEDTEESDLPEENRTLDIQLRESLRIMNDWIGIVKNDNHSPSLSFLNPED